MNVLKWPKMRIWTVSLSTLFVSLSVLILYLVDVSFLKYYLLALLLTISTGMILFGFLLRLLENKVRINCEIISRQQRKASLQEHILCVVSDCQLNWAIAKNMVRSLADEKPRLNYALFFTDGIKKFLYGARATDLENTSRLFGDLQLLLHFLHLVNNKLQQQELCLYREMLEQDLTFILQYMKKVCIHLQRYIWECDIKEKVAEDIRSLRDLVSALQNELADKLQHASK